MKPPAAGNGFDARTSNVLRVAGLVVLYALLALSFMRLPKTAVDQRHDSGSTMSFEFYARANDQFGVDVIQNVGPYGYLQYPYFYSGILPGPKLAFGILFGLVLALLALDARKYFPTAADRDVWFLALLFQLVMPGQELDPAVDLLILLAGHRLLMSDRRGALEHVKDAGLCMFLGLLLLLKSTNVLLIGFLLALVAVERFRTRRFRELASNVACVGLTALLLWIGAGQRVANVAAFMRGVVAFSSGYNEALATAGNPGLVWLALIVLACFAAINIRRLTQPRVYGRRLTTSVFEAACLFVLWKHAYVRAGHEIFFWASIVAAAPLLFLAHEPPSAAGDGARGAKGGLDRLAPALFAVTVACTICACRAEYDNPSYSGYASLGNAVEAPFRRIWGNVVELAGWPLQLAALKAKLEKNRADADLPKIKAAVGEATIDDFGYFPGLLLLNGLHYTPRPMPINFGATTDTLMERNAEFYRDEKTAPAYLLAEIGQVDGRLAPQDDALALLEVLTRYRLQFVENGRNLLKRLPGRPALERVPQEALAVGWGERAALPNTSGKMLWCAAEIRYSLIGRIRSLLFRPPPMYIVLESANRRLGPIRLLPSGASTGFLLRPLILHEADFLSAYGSPLPPGSSKTPDFDALRFVTENPRSFRPEIKLVFSTVESRQ